MNTKWRQILTGSVVAVIITGLGILETESTRARVDPVSSAPTSSKPGDERTTPGQDFRITQGELLNLELLGPPADWETRAPVTTPGLTDAIQADRMTVLQVDQYPRRIVGVNGRGQVRADEVAREAVVVTEDKKATDLALLNRGDLIKVEPRKGPIQKIVVLRQAWHEMASPEQ